MFRFLRENFILKAISLATSVMMWAYVSNERNPNPTIVRRLNAQVKMIGAPPPGLIVQVRTDPIPIEATGPKSEVESLTEKGENVVRVKVNLAKTEPNAARLPIEGAVPPPGAPNVSVRLLKFYADIEVVQEKKKRFDVTPFYKNQPPFGMLYSTPELKPKEAVVIGAEEDMQRVARLVVYVETQGGSVRGKQPIKALDRDGQVVENVRVEPESTDVKLDLVEAPAERALLVNVSHQGQVPPPYEIVQMHAEPDQVTVVGSAERLRQLSCLYTAPVLLNDIRADMSREYSLQLPDGVTVKDGRTSVRVTVKVRDTTSKPPGP